MKRKMLGILMMVLLIVGAASIAVTERRLTELENGVLRLHILANSDSNADQMLKLHVRDALLSQSERWMYNAENAADAEMQLQQHLPEIKAIAEATLRAYGSSEKVCVLLCDTEFPVRTYEDVTLPAGIYHALRVEIGAAEGHNWWCVMYPSLCVPAAGCNAVSEMSEEFSAGVCDMTANPSKYAVRFKCVEIVRGIRNYAFEKLTEEIHTEKEDAI